MIEGRVSGTEAFCQTPPRRRDFRIAVLEYVVFEKVSGEAETVGDIGFG